MTGRCASEYALCPERDRRCIQKADHVIMSPLHFNRAGFAWSDDEAREAAAQRRTWSFPEPPDDTVTTLRSGADNSLWRREGEWWRYAGRVAKGTVGTTRSWPELLLKYGAAVRLNRGGDPMTAYPYGMPGPDRATAPIQARDYD